MAEARGLPEREPYILVGKQYGEPVPPLDTAPAAIAEMMREVHHQLKQLAQQAESRDHTIREIYASVGGCRVSDGSGGKRWLSDEEVLWVIFLLKRLTVIKFVGRFAWSSLWWVSGDASISADDVAKMLANAEPRMELKSDRRERDKALRPARGSG